MVRSKSSRRWLQEQRKDPYIKLARQHHYRSRAAYKLLEIDQRYQLLGKGKMVIDLGAAPGGWSQVAAEKVGESGQVIAVDLLPMDPIPGVTSIQGDFTTEEVLALLHELLNQQAVHVVMSDMAPNLTGVSAVDQARSMRLVEAALTLSEQVLQQDGQFLAKLFQGEDYAKFIHLLRSKFKRVVTVKPSASRDRSREMYVVAQGYKLV